tara:strand:+ start:258 stop:839 length:582 start_codon:yes stop_codon:yes gene_type:complete
MANLWSFFGLPDPDGVIQKPKKVKSQNNTTSADQTLSITEQQLITPVEEGDATGTKIVVPTLESTKKIPVPPNWKGPISADGEPFHDLGEPHLSRRSFPSRALRYVSPDEMKRIPTRGIAQRISNGDTVIVDLRSLVHMDAHQNACRRDLKMMSQEVGVGIFALDAEDKLLMIPGSDVIVDLGNYQLGLNPLM